MTDDLVGHFAFTHRRFLLVSRQQTFYGSDSPRGLRECLLEDPVYERPREVDVSPFRAERRKLSLGRH